MNGEIGTEPAQFLFWEYLFRIFGIVSLQCTYLVKNPLVYEGKDAAPAGPVIRLLGWDETLLPHSKLTSCNSSLLLETSLAA